jgi:general secretion pathway protein E
MENQTSILNEWFSRIISELDSHDQDFPNLERHSLPALAKWAIEHQVSEDYLYKSLASVLGYPWQDFIDVPASERFIANYPLALAREKKVLAVETDEHPMRLFVCNCDGIGQLDHVRRWFDVNATLVFTNKDILERCINESYENRASATTKTIDDLSKQTDAEDVLGKLIREDVLDADGRSPIVKLVNSILFDAIKTKASDVHIQPYPEHLQIRFRIDGVLFDQFTVPKSYQEEVLSRVKILGKMDIAEKRLPQDGRTTVELGNRTIDLRIASLPTADGERIVVRLLDQSSETFSLEELGMPPNVLAQFRKIINREHGIVLVTGPTGSGKSTTLYAALQEINASEKNIVTLEDPIEYQLHRISQTQINEKKGLTFARGLRNILRQDPDIIMVGEIRDRETAEMAIQSSLTGHLVFSTLHTNDAASAVTRLFDLGIEPYLVSSSLAAVMAQRLVRRLCSQCKQPLISMAQENGTGHQEYAAVGCPNCRETGYKGRLGLFELMHVNSEIQSLIQSRANASQISRQAINQGMLLLRQDGLEKIAQGKTTLAEVSRVTSETLEI